MMSRTSPVPFILGLALLAAAVPASAQAAPAKAPQLVRIVGKGEKVRATPTAQALRRYAGKRLTLECGRPTIVFGRSEAVAASVVHEMTVRKGASVPAWEPYCVARVRLGGKPGQDPRQLLSPTVALDVLLERLKAINGLRRAYRSWQNAQRNPTLARVISGDKTGTFVAASGPDDSADAPHVALWPLGPAGGRPSGGSRASTRVEGSVYYLEHDYVTNVVSSNAFDYFEQLDQGPALTTELLAPWQPRPEPVVPAQRGIALPFGDLSGLSRR